jgi:hypothetical protein
MTGSPASSFPSGHDFSGAASKQEKQEIRRAVSQKIESYYLMVERGKKSSAEYKAIAPRIRKFFQDKPQTLGDSATI